MFTPTVISTERSEWRNLFKDVSTALDMTGVNSYIKTLILRFINYQTDRK